MNKLVTLGLAALVLTTLGAIVGTGIIQSVQAVSNHHHDVDDVGHGQSFHDVTGDLHSGGIA